MALSSNDTVDPFAQGRLQALAKTRDLARTRAADAAAQRFSLESSRSAARTDAARTARSDAADRATAKGTAPKPAPSRDRAASPAATATPPAKGASPAAGPGAARQASASSAPAAAQARPAAKPDAADATTPEAALAGEAQATLAAEVDGIDEETSEDEASDTASAAAGEPAPTLLAPTPPATRSAATAAAEGEEAATAVTAGSARKVLGAAIEGITGGKDAQGDDSPAETGFAASLPDAAGPVAPADLAPARGGVAASTATAHAAPAAAAQAGPPPVPIGQVPLTIGLRSLAGSSQFEIRLDPLELGRIDVKLDIDKDRGTVATRIVVERPETLALLQRDASQLQQALTQAGLDPSAAGIDLSLRGQGADAGTGDGGRRDAQAGGPRRPLADTTETRNALDAVPLRSLRGIGSLDIRI